MSKEQKTPYPYIQRWPFRCLDYRCKNTVYWWNHFHVAPFMRKPKAPCGHEWECIVYAEELMQFMEDTA